jgi:hypothetical protein
MIRVKKLAWAALVALAVAAGGLAVGGEAAQIAGSKGDMARLGRESASVWAAPDQVQIASSAGTRAKIGRESS